MDTPEIKAAREDDPDPAPARPPLGRMVLLHQHYEGEDVCLYCGALVATWGDMEPCPARGAVATCACHATDPYACWSSRYDVEESAVEEDGGPCVCDCHKEEDVWAPADRVALDARIAAAWAYMTRRRFGRSSRAQRRRARRRADIQLVRKSLRRGACPCGDPRIENPGPHLATCRWANDEEGECPF